MNLSDIERIDRITAAVHYLLKGEEAAFIPCEDDAEDEIRQLSQKVNRLIGFLRETREFAVALSAGNLDIRLPAGNFLGSPFKQLHAGLKHLTWQAQQIAKGDLNQRVDFMGDFSNAFNTMVEALAEARNQLTSEVDQAEQLAQL
ncbi:MAG: HAMP domain-containing protein, partial [Planctomycetes bacterium]|nr:HAMP domain-containing protein [Planctomycetota bacterium]